MPNKQTVLIVDDTPENLDVLNGTLRGTYKVKVASSGEKALRIAAGEPKPDLILLDIMMPEMDGYEVCRRLKADPLTRQIPVIFITAKTEIEDERLGFELGAVDYIAKPISPPIVQARVRAQLALYDQSRELARLVAERTSELNDTRVAIIARLGRAAEFKDNETGLHVIRMSRYSKLIAEAIGASEDWVELLHQAAPMHDIGKIGVPDRILQKPGKLDETEWETMKQHPAFGAEIIGDHPSELLQLSREIAFAHHEKWDGTGYPKGLKGTEIPLSARVVAIADVFDALTTPRPYKKAWAVEDAIKLIEDGAGQHFDAKLVGAFREVLPQVLKVRSAYAEADA